MKECRLNYKRSRFFIRIGFFLIFAGVFSACGIKSPKRYHGNKSTENRISSRIPCDAEKIVTDLIAKGKKFLGKPYRYRGPSKWPMDCSGYIAYLYSCYDINIPRSSSALYNYTIPIRYPLPGDLLFFRGRNKNNKRIGHVALLIEVREDELIMIHNTNSRGIIIESLQASPYFRRRYVGAGRLPEIQACME